MAEVRVVERESGVEVYPKLGERATINPYHMALTFNADLRRRAPIWAGIAERLVIVTEPVPWEVAMGFMSQEDYDARPDEHPGDDHPLIEDGWS